MNWFHRKMERLDDPNDLFLLLYFMISAGLSSQQRSTGCIKISHTTGKSFREHSNFTMLPFMRY